MNGTRQIIYDEDAQQDIEILSDTGAEELFRCFMDDFQQYRDITRPDTGKNADIPLWDSGEASNWDYMLCGIQDLYDYAEFMEGFAEDVGDNSARFAYNCCLVQLDELQQVLGELLDYTNGDSKSTKYSTSSYKFWSDLYHTILFAYQASNDEQIDREVLQ